MTARHVFWAAAVAVSIALTIVGLFKGAALLLGLATVVELLASIVNGKKTNI